MDQKDKLKEEINRRRTFAIISHPDAGKTTLTEKFLLYAGEGPFFFFLTRTPERPL